MEKKPTSAITVIFYIIGIIFLAVSAFMLYTAISYTRTYLQTYDATFSDMWSNSVQYIIAQFVPYLGIGVVCLGIGKAIKESRKAAGVQQAQTPAEVSTDVSAQTSAEDSGLAEKLDLLAKEIDAMREVLSIKIEEKEKRDSYRLNEMGKRLESVMVADAVLRSESEAIIPVEDMEAMETAEAECAECAEPAECAKPEGDVPPLFRIAAPMAMPEIPRTISVPSIMSESGIMAMPEVPHFIKVPAIMRMSGIMAMPEIIRTGEWLEDLDAYAKRDARKDTFSKIELEEAIAREEVLQEMQKDRK